MELNQVCYRTLGLDNPASMSTYQSLGGYEVARKIFTEKTDPAKIIDELKKSVLRGRGGAGFPTGLKWSFISRDKPGQKYILCNSDESEPGTCKDRIILLNNPHQLFEGMLIGCYVTGAQTAYNLLRGEFWEPFEACEKALQEARDAGFIGKNVFGSGIDIEIHNTRTAGAYICGEETGLMNAIEGRRPLPRFKPPFPANYGLYGCPSNVNNTESLASVPVILQKGGDWFAKLGTEKSGGTKIFCVSGHVAKPGNFEVGLGIPFKDLLEMAGGMRAGSTLKAVIPGGSSMPVVPAEMMMGATMDFEGVQAVGSMLGSGGIMVMDHKTCMVKVLQRISKFYMHESCGQCTPCREGTGWLYRLVTSIINGEATMKDLDRLAKVAKGIEGRTICAFGEAAAWPVGGMLKHFYDEFEYYVKHGKSMVDNDD